MIIIGSLVDQAVWMNIYFYKHLFRSSGIYSHRLDAVLLC